MTKSNPSNTAGRRDPSASTRASRSTLVQAFRLGGVEIDIRRSGVSPDLEFAIWNTDQPERACRLQIDQLGSLAKLIDIALWWYFSEDDASC